MSQSARPTLRVLREDLEEGWASPFVRRALEKQDFASIQPLDSLDHPILQKAADSIPHGTFGADSGPRIVGVKSEFFVKVRSGQWRAAVWVDDDASWVVSAGLAKGGHDDHEDFYEQLERMDDAGHISRLLPSEEDRGLLKRERADALLTAWQIENQKHLVDELAQLVHGGRSRFALDAPGPSDVSGPGFGTVTIEVNVFHDDEYDCEDVTVEFAFTDRWEGTPLSWMLRMQVLAAIHPPEQTWDTVGGMFSNLLETGTLESRVQVLDQMTTRGDIATSHATRTSHFTHRRSLAERSVNGEAVRALCGTYFVPRQDPETMPRCPDCQARFDAFSP